MFTGNEDHKVSLETGSMMTKRYRDTISFGTILGGYFGKRDMEELLDQSGCVGFRYYYGFDANYKSVMVLVGTDANENDLTDGIILEMSLPGPTSCSSANELNSDI